jgi:glutathione S-transferase
LLRLHGTIPSINTYKVRLLLAILDVPYELVQVDMYGGDFTVADSHACLVYVARKYDRADVWLPSAAAKEGKVAEWLSKSANEVHQGPWMKRAKIRRPEAIKLSDEEIDARCDHILRIMDTHLRNRRWLALEHATIADLSCFAPISMLKVSGYDTDRWVNVTRWLGAVRALPRAIDIEGAPYA